ncbi:MAG: hypothetical protein JSS10_00040 [Verrucomicrobia bacterium]|nr:hypothetical protein [Verrucomicrobiota bacterium]
MLDRPTLASSVLPIGTVYTPQPIGAGVPHPPQPPQLSCAALIGKRIKEDVGRYALYCILSLAGKCVLPRSLNISSWVPVYVVVTALALTVIHELSEVLIYPPSSFKIKLGDATILGMSFGVTSAIVKVCHIQVTSIQGMLFFIIIFPIAEIMHQIFEE